MNGDSRGVPGHRPVVVPATTDSRRLARLRIGREAERLMPLVRYYGPRPLLDVTIGELYVRGRWAA